MEHLGNEIRLTQADSVINQILKTIQEDQKDISYTMHFNQNEEFFLNLSEEISVPSFPIHHDVRKNQPANTYLQSLTEFVKAISTLLPSVFSKLTWFFDPGETLKPGFFHLFKVGDALYLYILRIDLLYRARDGKIIAQGSNDDTASYKTHHLYLESEFIPLSSVKQEANSVTVFTIKQSISETWIGETGRGYLIRGIWMDNDLSLFFSKLFMPKGKRIYPFFPFFCKYKTICAMVPNLSAEGRKAVLPLLHKAILFLEPEMQNIQEVLKAKEFSESMQEFIELKTKIPEAWLETWAKVSISPYLNDDEMKEYLLEL